jgi:hypothetical protein
VVLVVLVVTHRALNNSQHCWMCFLRYGSDPRLYNESLFVALISIESRQNQENGNKTEYNGIRELSLLSVGNSHGKLAVKEELEVSL